MYTRVPGLGVSVLILLLATGCGGDDDAAASMLAPCEPMSMSIPTGGADDPCKQDDPVCPKNPGTYTAQQAACSAYGCKAVATCMPNRVWNSTCQCLPNGPPGGSSPPLTGGTGGSAGLPVMMQPPVGGAGTGVAGAGGMAGGTTCGNSVVDTDETCDGSPPAGMTCASMNMGSGTLTCDPLTCEVDTSGCMGPMNMAGMGGNP